MSKIASAIALGKSEQSFALGSFNNKSNIFSLLTSMGAYCLDWASADCFMRASVQVSVHRYNRDRAVSTDHRGSYLCNWRPNTFRLMQPGETGLSRRNILAAINIIFYV